MKRITLKDIEAVCDRLNAITGSPETPWSKINGRMVSNVGNYHVSQQYGGYNIHRMDNSSGGVSAPIQHGHTPARELFNKAQSYIRGMTEQANPDTFAAMMDAYYAAPDEELQAMREDLDKAYTKALADFRAKAKELEELSGAIYDYIDIDGASEEYMAPIMELAHALQGFNR